MPALCAEIEALLRSALHAEYVYVEDESAQHAGHAGAMQGGGHYAVVIAAAVFQGLSLVDRHRRVYDALGDLMQGKIHALKLKTFTPEEFKVKRRTFG